MSSYPGQGQPAGGQYPPPAGNQPPHGGQYPPPAGGQYPPPASGQYPPPSGGQYPPPTYPQGAAGQYPPANFPQGSPSPAGQMYPPHNQPGFPPQVGGAYPPAGSQAPSHMAYPPPQIPGGHHQGGDLDDSDPEYDIRSKQNQKPVAVRFVNKTGKKVNLQWINHEGEFEKCRKIKEGKSEVMNTYEGHVFVVDGKKKKSKHVIDQNRVYFVRAHGQTEVVAEIKKGNDKKTAKRSTEGGHPVRVKFSNRTHANAVISWVDANGGRKVVKELAPRKCWLTDSKVGHCFTAHKSGQKTEKSEKGHKGEQHLDLNYDEYHVVVHGGDYNKVIITEGRHRSGSSSSSSDSS